MALSSHNKNSVTIDTLQTESNTITHKNIVTVDSIIENRKENKRSRKLATVTSESVDNSEEVPEILLPKRSRQKAEEKTNQKDLFMHPFQPPKNIKTTIRNGIRYLQPYWGVFNAYAKKRWLGKPIGEVITSEFTIFHSLYAVAAIRTGRIFINGEQMTDPEYRFNNNDFILHLNHRHETEIPAFPIEFIDETDDYLVINKPPGLPVHPCGRYNLHCVMSILKREYGREDSDKLRPLFRLDRNTTGVLMFAKNYQADIKFKDAIVKRQLEKEYIAKVDGIFPEGEIICRQPIGLLSRSTGIRCVRSDGQDALSRFRQIHANPEENTSIVNCKIETGRTHQIRIHLQYLGYPIVNDNLYNDDAWGPLKGRGCDYGGKSMEQLNEDVTNRHNKNEWLISTDPSYEERLREIVNSKSFRHEEHQLLTIKLEELPDYDPICWDCAIYEKKQMTERDWQMPLHCLRYAGDGWSFEAPLPEWARTMKQTKMVKSTTENKEQQIACAIPDVAVQTGDKDGKTKCRCGREGETVMAHA